jgi:hydrogenase expression/formation protein HypC
MCLAVPARVMTIEGEFAAVDLTGVKMQVCVGLLDDLQIGDYVIVHAGFAISKLDLAEAEETLKLFREIANGRT